MIKHYYILVIALKSLYNNKLRVLAIVIPLTLIIAMISAVSFYFDGVKKDALLAVSFFPDILLQQQVGGRTESLYWDRYEDPLKEIKGIQSMFPRVWAISIIRIKTITAKPSLSWDLSLNLSNKASC